MSTAGSGNVLVSRHQAPAWHTVRDRVEFENVPPGESFIYLFERDAAGVIQAASEPPSDSLRAAFLVKPHISDSRDRKPFGIVKHVDPSPVIGHAPDRSSGAGAVAAHPTASDCAQIGVRR